MNKNERKSIHAKSYATTKTTTIAANKKRRKQMVNSQKDSLQTQLHQRI